MLNFYKKMRYLIVVLLCLFPLYSSYSKDTLKEQANFYREKGYELQTLGEWQKALMYYQKAMNIYPYDAQLHNDIGVVYERMGREDEAVGMYQRSLELDENYLPAYTNLAFFYEKKKDLDKASQYWKKRYELSPEADSWKQVAKDHLLKLGTYPKFEKERLEKQAAKLSREVVKAKDKEREDKIKEARMHFDIGYELFNKGDFVKAMEEMLKAKAVNAQDSKLNEDSDKIYKEAERLHLRQQALSYTQEALNCIDRNDFLSAGEKLNKAISVVCRISQKK